MVLLVLLSISVAVVGLALFGAVSLFMQPSLPKVLFGAAITLAVWIAIAQKRLTT